MIQQTFSKKEKEYWIKIGKEHQAQDRFNQGEWIRKDKDKRGFFKGCFFGCFMQSDENVLSTAAKTMNIPEWLVRVSEKIFEGLSQEESLTFPVELLEAIPENSDLTKKWKEWNYSLMMDDDHGQYKYAADNVKCQNAIKGVADLFLLDVITYEAAAIAARSADSVSRAEDSVYLAAAVDSAASAARAAVSAVDSAVDSAAAAAEAAAAAAAAAVASSVYLASDSVVRAAAAAHYTWMKTNLIEILKS